MSDYKDGIQTLAEDMAWERYQMEFFDLSNELQYAIYEEAMREYPERLQMRADMLTDMRREDLLR